MSLDELYLGLIDMNGLISGGFLPTLIGCLVICPGIPYLLGAVLDGYWVPWRSEFQFYAFLPGNLFLATGIAASSLTFQREGFSIHPVVNVVVFVGSFLFWVALNVLDLKSHYTPGQLKSAMKIYHNSLYFWYGYLAVVCYIAMWFSSTDWFIKVVFTIPGALWMYYMKKDNDQPEEIQNQRFRTAHVASLPPWKNNWRIRRLTKTSEGYVYV